MASASPRVTAASSLESRAYGCLRSNTKRKESQLGRETLLSVKRTIAMVLPPRDEPVAAAGEAVDVEHFAVRRIHTEPLPGPSDRRRTNRDRLGPSRPDDLGWPRGLGAELSPCSLPRRRRDPMQEQQRRAAVYSSRPRLIATEAIRS